jgi:hypothetical protein
MCKRFREIGFQIWLDTGITCNHVGMKKYTGNFENWLQRLLGNQLPVQQPAANIPPPTTNPVGGTLIKQKAKPSAAFPPQMRYSNSTVHC